MSRIFIGLAALNAVALLLSFSVGFVSEGRASVVPDVPLTAVQRAFTFHLLSGLFAALLTLLVHSVIFTYFIGTGRWVQEVVAAYELPSSFWLRSRRLKTRLLPFILGSITVVIVAAILGAASDRGLLDANYHLAASVLAIAFNFWSYLYEYRAVRANGNLLDQIMSEVTQLRHERGLT